MSHARGKDPVMDSSSTSAQRFPHPQPLARIPGQTTVEQWSSASVPVLPHLRTINPMPDGTPKSNQMLTAVNLGRRFLQPLMFSTFEEAQATPILQECQQVTLPSNYSWWADWNCSYSNARAQANESQPVQRAISSLRVGELDNKSDKTQWNLSRMVSSGFGNHGPGSGPNFYIRVRQDMPYLDTEALNDIQSIGPWNDVQRHPVSIHCYAPTLALCSAG
jgi:hypothetical protein